VLPFDLHVLSIPPAFNLSQDQTLQFKFDSCLWQPIFLTRDSRIELLSFECSLSIFGHPKSTEHPHKLPDRIVKELPDIFVRERPPILLDWVLVSSFILTFFKLAVKPGPLESAYSTVRLVFVNNYLEATFALPIPSCKCPKVPAGEARIIRRSRGSSIGFMTIFFQVTTLHLKAIPAARFNCHLPNYIYVFTRAKRRLPT
jgi:hypothetical protein